MPALLAGQTVKRGGVMTDQTMRASSAPQFSIGNVLGTSFSVLGRNVVPFAVIAIIVAIPSILITRFYGIDPITLQEQVRTGYFSLSDFSARMFVYWLVVTLTSSLVSAALIYGTFQDLRGHPASVGDAITRGFSTLVPVILAALAYSILLAIGFVLLFVPGIIIMVALWVYMPAIVVEKQGVGGAFNRSRELTKGRRWAIFGLLIVVGVMYWIASWIIGFVFGLILGFDGVFWAGQVVRVLLSMFAAALAAVGYYYLRADKEGIAIHDLAAVFD
jgi:hypothetical protein